MKLLVDIGNTRLKSALLREGKLHEHRTLCWHGADLNHRLAALWSDLQPTDVAISSVASSAVVDTACAFAAKTWQIEPRLAEYRGELFGLRCGYIKPESLGIDRWLAMLGAWSRQPIPWLVADLGTAATLDVIDRHGQHLGGCIYAGIETQRRALSQQTAELPAVGNDSATRLARDTEGGMALGTLLSVAGGVRELLYEAEKWPECAGIQLCLTGGAAPVVAERLGVDQTLYPDLVLEGLAMNEFSIKISMQ